MKSLFTLFVALAFSSFASAKEGWTDNMEAARAQAKRENKKLMLDFTGSDWCGWCKKLDREVFSTQEFKEYARKNLVLVELDFPHGFRLSEETRRQNEALQARYRVDGYPTVIVLSPEGSKLATLDYVPGGPMAFIKTFDRNPNRPAPTPMMIASAQPTPEAKKAPPAEKPPVAKTQPAPDRNPVKLAMLEKPFVAIGKVLPGNEAKKVPARTENSKVAEAQPARSTGLFGRSGWLDNIEEARTQARRDNKRILLAFTNPDSARSRKLDREVLSSPEFKDYAKRNFVLVQVESPQTVKLPEATQRQNEALQAKYNVETYPRVVVLNPSGSKNTETGYVDGGPQAFIRTLGYTPPKEGWFTNLENAKALAKRDNKKVLLEFTSSDWCPKCKKLDKDVFGTQEFRDYARKNLVLVEVDLPRTFKLPETTQKQNEALQSRYNVWGYPKVVVLDATGAKTAETGYVEGGPQAFLRTLDRKY